jgi:hypothetical protein
MRQSQPHHPQGLHKIQLENRPPVVIRAVGDTPPAPATSYIVDQDIDAAECGSGRLGQPCGLIGESDVGDLRSHFGATCA